MSSTDEILLEQVLYVLQSGVMFHRGGDNVRLAIANTAPVSNTTFNHHIVSLKK